MKPETQNKIDAGGVFKGPLTYSCPECHSYHTSVKAANKCLKLAEGRYDRMFNYYNELRAKIAEAKQ